MNQAIMLGVVPPITRYTKDDSDLNSAKTDREWGLNVRTTILCPTRPKAPGIASLYQSYREKLYDNQSLKIVS
jgi:hypothetical protein